MRVLAHKLKAYLPILTESIIQESCTSIDFIKSRKLILAELRYCLNHGNLVGIYSDVLGSGMFLLGVEDIITLGDNEVIVFYSHDLSGLPINRRTLFITEISMVVPFNNPYSYPVHQPIRDAVQTSA